MRISKQTRHEARQLFRSCLVNGTMDDSRVRRTVQAVIAAKPRGYLPILTHFERLVRLEVARRTARIESATQLAPQFQSQVQSELTQRYGPGLSFAFGQNPSLIGGMRIQVGGDVYDGSVSARLRALQEAF